MYMCVCMPWTNDNYFSVNSQWFTWNNKITEGGKYIFDHFRFYLMLFGLVFYNVYGLACSEHIEGMNKLKLKCIKCAFHNWKQQAQTDYSYLSASWRKLFSLCFIYTNITFRSSYNKPKDFLKQQNSKSFLCRAQSRIKWTRPEFYLTESRSF